MDEEEALAILYGNGFQDLTPEGYLTAISMLRRKDKALALQVERALDRVLKEVFPRRNKGWYETSQGMRARLYLLPDNPHLEKDVMEIREVLGIPPDQVQASAAHPLWKKMEEVLGPESIRRAVEGTLAGRWLRIHRRSALAKPMGAEPGQLGAARAQPGEELLELETRESAEKSARLDLRNAVIGLTGKDIPQWLRRPPGMAQAEMPMDWVAARLVERYRLSWLEGIDLSFGLVATKDPGPLPYQGSSITIWGLDEYVKKEDWDQIWEQDVEPRQEGLWEERGMKPQGRRTADLERLRDGVPLYRIRMEKKISVEKAISELTSSGELSGASMEQRNARRMLKELKALLAPKEEG
jgi:hypothetical protein